MPAVEHAKDDAIVLVNAVIHNIRKAFSEQPVKLKDLRMQAGKNLEGINIGK